MSHKTIAYPARLFKSGTRELRDDLSDDEKIEVAKLGHQRLTADELAERQLEEIAHQEKMEAEAEDYKKNGYKYRRKEKFDQIPLGDQLDALWKALAVAENLPQESKDMLKRIQDVKNSEPKSGS